jgi:hypothetical protein
MSHPFIGQRSRYPLRIILGLWALAAPVLLGWLILQFAVNVPYWDQWHTPGSLFKAIYESQPISFETLIAQHNESRKFFPRLIFLATAYLTHWDIRYEMLLIFLTACLISINVFQVACKTFGDDKDDRKSVRILLFIVIANLLIFSPAQYENWLWGIQLVVFLPTLCLTTGILICYSNLKIDWKVLLGVLLATISTYSYANGLLCWLLLPLTALLSGHGKALKGRIELIAGWTIACVGNLVLYSWNYHKPPQHPSFFEGLAHPIKALTYFMVFMGSPLSGGQLGMAEIVGGLVMVLYAVILGLLLLGWRSANLRYRVAGWLTMAAYVLASGLVTTLGRVGFGIEQALASRYTTFSVYGLVALVALTMIVFDQITPSVPRAAQTMPELEKPEKSIVLPTWLSALSLARPLPYVALGLLTTLVILHIVAQGAYVKAMDSSYRDRLYAQACLTYADFVEETCIGQSLFPIAADPKYFRGALAAVRSLQFVRPAAPTAKLTPAGVTGGDGWLDEIHLVGTEFRASGWATLGTPERSADAVLLSYQDDDGSFKVFTVAPVKEDRPDVAQVKHNQACRRSGWTINFSRQRLPKRAVEISGWAYDTKTDQVFPLLGKKILPLG